MHPPPAARCIPQVDVTGIEPARGLCLQGLGLSTFDTHPTILSWLGNLTQWWADGCPVAGLLLAILGVHALSRQDKEKGLLLPLPFTLLQRRTRGAEEARTRL